MDDKPEVKEEQRRNQQPLMYCSFISKYPRLAFGLTLGGHLFLMSLNFILLAAGYDILPVEFEDFPIRLTGEEAAQREAAWRLRNQDDLRIQRIMLDNIGPTWNRGHTVDTLLLYYTDNQQNVFTKEVLLAMQQLEDSLFTLPDYQMKYCQLGPPDSDGVHACIKPNSVIRYFDGSLFNISSVFYDPYFDNIPQVLYEAYTHPETKIDFQYFLGKGYAITPVDAFSEVTRTGIPLGWPLSNDTDADHDAIDAFLLDVVKDTLEREMKDVADTVDTCYFSIKFFTLEVLRQALLDMLLAVGSLCFIFGFLWFQTGSFWITSMAILSIITSFWITNLIYRIILDYRYFGYFHVISIFIILGIGADDVFVFFNTWRSSGFWEYPSLAHRISDCYRRAAGTMFFTSFTTMVAFLTAGLSPLLPIDSFGIFTGVLVAVNYISVIVFFPTVIVMYHNYFEEYTPICCRPCQRRNVVNDETMPSDKEDESPPAKKRNIIVTYFKKYHFKFVSHKIVRWILIVLFLTFIGLSIWSASRIEVDAEEVKIYRENTNYGKAMRLEGNAFIPSGDKFVMVLLVWGMKPRDFSGCHFSDHRCTGEQVWDDHFDMNSAPAQLDLQEFCTKLRYDLTEKQLKELMIKNNSLTGQLEIECYMDNLHDYMKLEEARLAVNGTLVDLDYPLTQTNMDEYMRVQDMIYEPELLPRSFYRHFEIGVSHWLTGGYRMRTTSDFLTFDAFIGERIDEPHTLPVKFHRDILNISIAAYGTALRYVGIRVNLSLSTQDLNYITGFPVMDSWEDFMEAELAKMTAQLQGGFQCTEHTWHWLMVQETLVQDALLGIIIGVSVACPVLILATLNLIVGLFATLNIACITIGVLGFIPFAGWKLDIMVSMNLCILVGLSVDYVVHLAEGYHLSARPDRLGRVQDTLEELGISVLSGAITTIGAATFMLFAKIQFFFQFGTFLLCTIGFSLLFSLFFFTTVLALCGPQNEFGSILPPFRFLKRRIIGRSKKDIDCSECNGKGFISPGDDENAELNSISSESDENVTTVEAAENKHALPNGGINGPYEEKDIEGNETKVECHGTDELHSNHTETSNTTDGEENTKRVDEQGDTKESTAVTINSKTDSKTQAITKL